MITLIVVRVFLAREKTDYDLGEVETVGSTGSCGHYKVRKRH